MIFYSIPHVNVPLVSGFGVDPALHVDIFQEFDLVRSSAGVSQVQGFHNESRAYLFEGTSNLFFYKSIELACGSLILLKRHSVTDIRAAFQKKNSH